MHDEDGLAMAEMRHRHANNLQLIISLVTLRAKEADYEETRQELQRVLDLVTTLGILQECLAQPHTTDFRAYMEKIGRYWAMLLEGRGIAVRVRADSFAIAETQASTLALILHELVANAIEHGFPSQRPGQVEMALRRLENGHGELVVTDNGIGFKGLPNASDAGGLSIAARLAKHIGGSLQISHEHSTRASVTFPL